jgi:ribosomal protein L30/L7E
MMAGNIIGNIYKSSYLPENIQIRGMIPKVLKGEYVE